MTTKSRGALGLPTLSKTQCFGDQSISTGGHFYELKAAHNRFTADLRPQLMQLVTNERGMGLSICCHPYNLSTELIAREARVVTKEPGGFLSAPLSLETDVGWTDYANKKRRQIEPLLRNALINRGLF